MKKALKIVIGTAYLGGYFLFIIGAGVTTWGALTFGEWLSYMAAQVMYGAFWPLTLLFWL